MQRLDGVCVFWGSEIYQKNRPESILEKTHQGRRAGWEAGEIRNVLEAISKMSFGPNPALGFCFKSSKYFSMDVYPAVFAGRIETQVRLDFEPKSYF